MMIALPVLIYWTAVLCFAPYGLCRRPGLHDVQHQESRDEDAKRTRSFVPVRAVEQVRFGNHYHNGSNAA